MKVFIISIFFLVFFFSCSGEIPKAVFTFDNNSGYTVDVTNTGTQDWSDFSLLDGASTTVESEGSNLFFDAYINSSLVASNYYSGPSTTRTYTFLLYP